MKEIKRIIKGIYRMYCPLCDEDEELKAKGLRYVSVGTRPSVAFLHLCQHLKIDHKQIEPWWFFTKQRRDMVNRR